MKFLSVQLFVAIIGFGGLANANTHLNYEEHVLKNLAKKVEAYNANPNVENVIELGQSPFKKLSELDRAYLMKSLKGVDKSQFPKIKMDGNKIKVGEKATLFAKSIINHEIYLNDYLIKGQFKTLEEKAKYFQRILRTKGMVSLNFFWSPMISMAHAGEINTESLFNVLATLNEGLGDKPSEVIGEVTGSSSSGFGTFIKGATPELNLLKINLVCTADKKTQLSVQEFVNTGAGSVPLNTTLTVDHSQIPTIENDMFEFGNNASMSKFDNTLSHEIKNAYYEGRTNDRDRNLQDLEYAANSVDTSKEIERIKKELLPVTVFKDSKDKKIVQKSIVSKYSNEFSHMLTASLACCTSEQNETCIEEINKQFATIGSNAKGTQKSKGSKGSI